MKQEESEARFVRRAHLVKQCYLSVKNVHRGLTLNLMQTGCRLKTDASLNVVKV